MYGPCTRRVKAVYTARTRSCTSCVHGRVRVVYMCTRLLTAVYMAVYIAVYTALHGHVHGLVHSPYTSVTSRCSTKTAKLGTRIQRYDSPGTGAKDLDESRLRSPLIDAPNAGGAR